MKAFKAKHAALIGTAAVLCVVLWAAVHLLTGHRYRLYTNRLTSTCWRGITQLALPTSTLRARRVIGPSTQSQGIARVTIEYRMDRVFGGTVMRVQCMYGPDHSAPRSVAMNGVPVDAETLRRIRKGLAR